MPAALALSARTPDHPPDPPVSGGEVVAGPGVSIEDPAGIAHHQAADALVPGEGDHGSGRLVMGLGQASAVAAFEDLGPGPVLAPPTRSPLALGRGPPGDAAAPGFRFDQVKPGFGPKRTARHEQGPLLSHDGEEMDHAEVHTDDLVGVGSFLGSIALDLDLGRDVDAEPGAVGEQRDRPDGAGRVRDLPGEADDEGRATLGDGDPEATVLETEGAGVVARRHEGLLASGVAGRSSPPLAPPGRGHPRIGVATQDGAGTGRRQFAEDARSVRRQLTTQSLVGDKQRPMALATDGVQLDNAGPHVSPGAKQAKAASALCGGGAQRDPRRSMDDLRRIRRALAGHDPIMTIGCHSANVA